MHAKLEPCLCAFLLYNLSFSNSIIDVESAPTIVAKGIKSGCGITWNGSGQNRQHRIHNHAPEHFHVSAVDKLSVSELCCENCISLLRIIILQLVTSDRNNVSKQRHDKVGKTFSLPTVVSL